MKNIYYMLSYVFDVLIQSDFVDVEKEEFNNIQDLFAAILSSGIGQQLKRGLYREYLSQREDLPNIRGKVDLVGTVKHKVAHRQMLSCDYDGLSENNLLNQIVKTTAMLLIAHEQVRKDTKDNLKREMLFFSEVDTIDPSSIPWAKVRFHRYNQIYHMLVGICQLTIEGCLLTENRGRHRLASFLDERAFYSLYEKFILHYYKKEFRKLQQPRPKAKASEIQWVLDKEIAENKNKLPIMRSDITLTYNDSVLIIDAKCYDSIFQKSQYGDLTHRSNNLYQIYTYVKNVVDNPKYKGRKVSGLLLYARTDEEGIGEVYSYQMSGNQIDVRTLNLNDEFAGIKDQLNTIARDLCDIPLA